MGYVYLLHAVGTDRYKIGMTVSEVQNRVYVLQTGCPFELRIVSTIESENAHTLEQRLHHRFKQFRVRGEWFTFNSSTPGIAETFGIELTNTPCEVGDEPSGYVRLVDDSVKPDPVIKTETVYIDKPVYIDRTVETDKSEHNFMVSLSVLLCLFPFSLMYLLTECTYMGLPILPSLLMVYGAIALAVLLSSMGGQK